MLIREITTRTACREVKCLVVDYDRLKPDGWPRLTPVGEFTKIREWRSAASRRNQTRQNAHGSVDRIRALELLTLGLATTQVAARLGCHRSAIYKIRAAAALP